MKAIKIAVCGSMVFAQEMKTVKEQLEELGFVVYIPEEAANFDYKDYTSLQGAKLKIEHDFIRAHFNIIEKSTAILVLNHEKKGIKNYVGGNTLMEMGFAFGLYKDIFMMNPSPALPYQSEIDGMQPIVINGNVNEILQFYKL